jgi:hypothetical protein
MRFSDRKLTWANVWGLEAGPIGNADHGVSGTVRLQFSAFDGSDAGPTLTIEIGAVCDQGITIPDAEKLLLAAALDLLIRGSSETAESVHMSLVHSRNSAILKPSEN